MPYSDHYAPRPGQFVSIRMHREMLETEVRQLEGQVDTLREALCVVLAEAKQQGYDRVQHTAEQALAQVLAMNYRRDKEQRQR